jgi:hypothetical protein
MATLLRFILKFQEKFQGTDAVEIYNIEIQ